MVFLPPQHVVKGGGFVSPLMRCCPIRPKNVLPGKKKEKKLCACSAWALGIPPARRNCIGGLFGHVGVPAAGAFCLYPQMAEKHGGYTLL